MPTGLLPRRCARLSSRASSAAETSLLAPLSCFRGGCCRAGARGALPGLHLPSAAAGPTRTRADALALHGPDGPRRELLHLPALRAPAGPGRRLRAARAHGGSGAGFLVYRLVGPIRARAGASAPYGPRRARARAPRQHREGREWTQLAVRRHGLSLPGTSQGGHGSAAVEAAAAPVRSALSPGFICRRLMPRRPLSSLHRAATVEATAAPVRVLLSLSSICRRLLPRRLRHCPRGCCRAGVHGALAGLQLLLDADAQPSPFAPLHCCRGGRCRAEPDPLIRDGLALLDDGWASLIAPPGCLRGGCCHAGRPARSPSFNYRRPLSNSLRPPLRRPCLPPYCAAAVEATAAPGARRSRRAPPAVGNCCRDLCRCHGGRWRALRSRRAPTAVGRCCGALAVTSLCYCRGGCCRRAGTVCTALWPGFICCWMLMLSLHPPPHCIAAVEAAAVPSRTH